MKPLSSMYTLPLRNSIRIGKLTILLLFGTTLILSMFLSRIDAQDELDSATNNIDNSHDRLAYVSADDDLMLYDPGDRTETKLLDNVKDFVLGQDGRIAFIKQEDPDLYIFDPSTPAQTPINISQNPSANSYPLAWSPDGHYLAFSSREESGDNVLYVWDGETTINIMPEDRLNHADTFYTYWSYDGRLAFTIQYGWSNLDTPPETYLWDGNATTDLSQNPAGWDSAASWSRNGQLMFGSQRNDENGVYVWDGVSFKDGSPDIDSFIRIAPELKPDYATWTNDGFIGFTVYPDSSPSGMKEIVVWDLKSEAIVKEFPISSDNAWSWLAEGGQMILSSQLASGIPSYNLDVENTEGKILFNTHTGEFSWSSDGYLAYCGIDEDSRSRILSLWNGKETWVVAIVSYKPARWQRGNHTFSCNNG